MIATNSNTAPGETRMAYIRFYEVERRPGIDYPWSIALTEENQDDPT
jgi:hypothetical protein